MKNPLEDRRRMSIFISDEEPLIWLVAMLHTDRFWDRSALTSYGGIVEKSSNSDSDSPDFDTKLPQFDSYAELYKAIEDFIQKEPKTSACFEAAQKAIEEGKIRKHIPRINEWGEKSWDSEGPTKVDSFQFLRWAEDEGFSIPQDLMPDIRRLIEMAFYREQSKREKQHQYPKITAEQFRQKRREPLWALSTGILYLLGHRSRAGGEKEAEFIKYNKLAEKTVEYAKAAFTAGHLKLFEYSPDQENPNAILSAKIEPSHLIEWARVLPLEFPMLSAENATSEKPRYCTPEMQLMYDAVQRFWLHYDQENPDINRTCGKSTITEWLKQEAKDRGFEISDNIANAMDTIMRCPTARKGGRVY